MTQNSDALPGADIATGSGDPVDVALLLRLEHEVADILTAPAFGAAEYGLLLVAIGSALGWLVGSVWALATAPGSATPDELQCVTTWTADGYRADEFVAATRTLALGPGVGLPGTVWGSGRPAWLPDVQTAPNFPRAQAAAQAGLHAAFCFPLVSRDGIEGLMEFFAPDRLDPEPVLLATMTSLGMRIGDAVRRQRVEDSIRRSEARLQAVLAASLDALIIADAEGVVLEFNRAACRTFGYHRDEAIGRELAELIVPPALRTRHRRGLARYLRTEKPRVLDRRIEITAMRSDGSVFPAELTITRIVVPGRPVFAGYVRDITERHQAEEELRASRHRVAEAVVTERERLERDLHDGAQQRLISLGTALARARTVLPDEPSRAAGILDGAIATLEEAAIELRNLARGIHPRSLTRYGLSAALADMARRSPVEMSIQSPPNERFPASVEATSYFVVSEALTNVARHAGTDRAQVRVTITDLAGPRGLEIVVSDDGSGGASAGSGTGLRGLADRIALLDGTFEVISPQGAGTVVRAWIPLPS
jgi:PAS domain S-box-containing protein